MIFGYNRQQETDAKSLGRRVAQAMREQCGLPGFADKYVLVKGSIENFNDRDFA